MRRYLRIAAGLFAAMIVVGPGAFGIFGNIGVVAVFIGACVGVFVKDVIVKAKGVASSIAGAMLGGLAAFLSIGVVRTVQELVVWIALPIPDGIPGYLQTTFSWFDPTSIDIFLALFLGLILSATECGQAVVATVWRTIRPRDSRAPTATQDTNFGADETMSSIGSFLLRNIVCSLVFIPIGGVLLCVGWLVSWPLSHVVSVTWVFEMGPLQVVVFYSILCLAFIIGVATGSILRVLLAVFESVWPYLRMMLLSTVGFIIGYVVIVVLFAGYFAMLYRLNQSAFNGKSEPSFGDFLFFSMMTMSTLGYTELKPVSRLAQVVVSFEAVASTGWTVVVFAAIIAYLEPHFAGLANRDRNARP